MKIESLRICNFRSIEELKIELGGRSAVFFGINGVGKSTILSSVNLLFGNIVNRIVQNRFRQETKLWERDIRLGEEKTEIGLTMKMGDQSYDYHRSIDRDNARRHSERELQEIVRRYYAEYLHLEEGESVAALEMKGANLPIFANYGVHRLVLKTPLRIRTKPDYGIFSCFEKAIENQIAFTNLFEWFLQEELFESQMLREDKHYVDPALKAVKTAMLKMLDGAEDVHIKAKPYSMQVKKEGERFDLLQMSDGEKCVLALFGDIARRLAIANPGTENPLDGEGVVLIDELELHMHTSWQRKILPVLQETFPNIQFIITTHSEAVMGELPTEFRAFALTRAGHTMQCEEIESPFGLDSNTVLEDVFHVDSVSREIKRLVEQMYEEIEGRQWECAEKTISEIRRLTGGRNADATRGELQIRIGRKRDASNR